MRIPAAIRTLWELPTRLSLRASLLLLLCVMSAIMIQHGVREASHDREEKTAEAQEELAKIASAVAERQTDLVTETRTSLRVLTDLPKANASLYPQCQDIFRRAVAERPWLTSITVFLHGRTRALLQPGPASDATRRTTGITLSRRSRSVRSCSAITLSAA